MLCSHLPTICACAKINAEHHPLTNPGCATEYIYIAKYYMIACKYAYSIIYFNCTIRNQRRGSVLSTGNVIACMWNYTMKEWDKVDHIN